MPNVAVQNAQIALFQRDFSAIDDKGARPAVDIVQFHIHMMVLRDNGKPGLLDHADHVFFQGVDKVKTVARLTPEFFLFHLVVNAAQLSRVPQMPVFAFGMAVKEQLQFGRIHGNISDFDTIFRFLCHYHIFSFCYNNIQKELFQQNESTSCDNLL